jgi:hypothetical protein
MRQKKRALILSLDECNRILRENKELKKKIERLERRIEKLKKQKKAIEDEFKQYKSRHPEIVGVKHGKPYVILSSTKSSSQKKRGAVIGHKGFFRPIPNEIDKEVLVPVVTCPNCNGINLSKKVQEIRTRVIEDIPAIKPVVLKYLIERRYCRDCKMIVESPLTQALPKIRIGIRVMLVVTYLKNGLRIPINGVQTLMANIFNFDVSEGEICLILKHIAKAFGPYYSQMLQDLKNAPARYIDETSWRIDGNNAWLWAFITKYESIYTIAATRCHDVPLNLLGTDYEGVDIHDRFSAYDALESKTKNKQQVCWAHIMNDGKELAQHYSDEGNFILKQLKKTYKDAIKFNHKGTEEDIDDLFDAMEKALNRPYKSSHCYKFVNNLLTRRNSLFEFVKNPYVESTNNRAERGLRHSVIARKISGGSKSDEGARIYGILTSVLHTIQQREKNFITEGMKIALTSHG